MTDRFAFRPGTHRAMCIGEVDAIRIGPGCTRRDLPSNQGVRVWIVEMEPGSQWPYIDRHDEHGEEYYVISGEVIEGDRRYCEGTYVTFAPGSQHQPHTDIGVQLLGINLI